MNWIAQTFGSSVGKKLLMAVTGLGFIGFLTAHLAGNLSIYAGREAFNSYALNLHALGPLLTVFELGLLALAAVHVFTGLLLFYRNWQSRPERYQVYKSSGGRTIGSATMPYTGILILLFVVFHLTNFSFVDKSQTTIFDIVAGAFQNPVNVAVYVAAMIVVALHVSHGFWSLFQSLGANHPKYMPIVTGVGLAVSIVFGVGFGFIPLYVTFMV